MQGGAAQDIAGISIDSRTIASGELFLAIRGDRFDGHDFIQAAISRGAAGAIVETASTETVRLPLVLTSQTFGMAILVVLISATLSFALVSRRLHHLDLLGVLKARD